MNRVLSLPLERIRAYEVALALVGFPSKKKSFTAEELNKKHRLHFDSRDIPYKHFGYISLEAFLKEIHLFFRFNKETHEFTIVKFGYSGYPRQFHIPLHDTGILIDL